MFSIDTIIPTNYGFITLDKLTLIYKLYDSQNNLCSILELTKNKVKESYVITLLNVDDVSVNINCSKNQKFYVNKNVIEAEQLSLGDIIIGDTNYMVIGKYLVYNTDMLKIKTNSNDYKISDLPIYVISD